MENKSKIIAYQGIPGAYSEAAALNCFPNSNLLSCNTFFQALEATRSGSSDLSIIPIENLIAGRVADVHALLPISQLYIIGEYFLNIQHQLLGLENSNLADIKLVLSHTQGLSQCRDFLEKYKIKTEVFADTAGSAQEVARRKDKTIAAIASERAGELYGLKVLSNSISNSQENKTRFLILSRQQIVPPPTSPCLTTLVFTVKSVPAALYKALGGFATNGINLTRIESYLSGNDFNSTTFSIDAETHPIQISYQNAIEELNFFANNVQSLGTYSQSNYRAKK